MSELIAAIATAPLPSGVGILRLSGPGAARAVGRIFRPLSGLDFSQSPPRAMVYGSVTDKDGNRIDRGLSFHCPAPNSYTGEETAELHCHGSPMVLSLALEALCAQGARLALPGEFTKRAFLNGKLDLLEAEAVIDLIEAETPSAARCAAGQLEGNLSRRVEEIYSGLVDLLAHFYAVLDYPEEDIDPFRRETIEGALEAGLLGVEDLLATYQRGRQITYGLLTAIVGRPNVGKSSLLNAMAGYQRAIVTNIPGTTRDTIEERVTLGGILLRLTDTAGLRETQDPVEALGVERSRLALEEAALCLLVLDASQPLEEEDHRAMTLALSAGKAIAILNKSDLPPAVSPAELPPGFLGVCPVSAATGEGLGDLEDLIARHFPQGLGEGAAPLLTNQRQQAAALRAKESLYAARESLLLENPPDLVLQDVEEALGALGELTGKTLREDITHRIFARFCVGK